MRWWPPRRLGEVATVRRFRGTDAGVLWALNALPNVGQPGWNWTLVYYTKPLT